MSLKKLCYKAFTITAAITFTAMPIKTIIFDLDGTIADTLPLCIAAFKKSIEPLLGKEVSEQQIIATFGPSEEGTIRKLIPKHARRRFRASGSFWEN
jgi:beta-phosphoglucomutase-like phosphatase (HAD superfamily)